MYKIHPAGWADENKTHHHLTSDELMSYLFLDACNLQTTTKRIRLIKTVLK